MFIVLIYFLVICLDFTVPEIVKIIEGGLFTENYQSFSACRARVSARADASRTAQQPPPATAPILQQPPPPVC